MPLISRLKTSTGYFSRLASAGVAIAIATGFLAGCGEQDVTSAKDSLKAAQTRADSAARCFLAGGGLGEDDKKLFAATGDGDVQRIAQLIDGGANIEAADSLKRTPLFAAVFCNHPQAINLLIDRGGDFNARDFSGMSPLHAAVVVGAVHAVRALIEKGANLDMRNTAGHTPLHLAAATNQIVMVELLLEHGANAQVHDKQGNTAAFLAADNGHATIVAALKKWLEKPRGQKQG